MGVNPVLSPDELMWYLIAFTAIGLVLIAVGIMLIWAAGRKRDARSIVAIAGRKSTLSIGWALLLLGVLAVVAFDLGTPGSPVYIENEFILNSIALLGLVGFAVCVVLFIRHMHHELNTRIATNENKRYHAELDEDGEDDEPN